MKSITLSTAVFTAIVGLSTPVHAADADHVQRLLDTRSCASCDLSNADLRGLDLSHTNLTGANLSRANLSQTNLSYANLTGANLYQTNFQQTNLTVANLRNANLTGATLEGANLSAANLDQATLNNTSLAASNLTKANLSHVDLSSANLSQTNLSNATLQSTTLPRTHQQGAKVSADNIPVTQTRAKTSRASLSQTGQSEQDLGQSEQHNIPKQSSAVAQGNSPATTDYTDSTATIQPSSISPLLSSQQPLISQAISKESSDNITAPLPTSTNAADLAQVDDEATPPTQDATPPAQTAPPEDTEKVTEEPIFSPLANQQFQQPTAIHLPNGAVSLSLYNRLFFLPGSEEESGTAAYPNVGITWGITDSTELDLTLQVVDTGTPDRLGPFSLVRRVDNRDLTVSVKQKLWKNPDENLALSGSFSLAVPLTKRSFEFAGSIEREGNSLIPALQFPLTASVSDRWQFTLSPTVAFFPDNNAVFIPTAPIANPGSFGTTLGLSGAISYQVHPRLTLWGDAFVPFTGNNSFDRDSGLPAKAIAYNAGLRYFLNPSLGVDLFASNAFGSKGPLALTADKDLTAIGVRVITLPSLFSANRRYANSFKRNRNGKDSPITTDGLAFFDGGTVPNKHFLFHLQGGGQGMMTALRYGVAKDFELSTYLDYIFGEVDESEQGFGIKLRFLNQDEGAPLTASAAVTAGLTNNLFDNFDNNNRDGLLRGDTPKDFPIIFATDSPEGRRFVVTFSLPLQYKVNDKIAVWLTPTAGFAQRNGIELGGFNVGGSVEVLRDLSVVGEVGANFLGAGNAFVGNTLADRIPWSAAIRLNPRSIIGGDKKSEKENRNPPSVEVFVTNRVGSSLGTNFA